MSIALENMNTQVSVGAPEGETTPADLASDFVGHVIAYFFGPEPEKDILLAGQVLDDALAGMQVAPSDGGVVERVVARDLEDLFQCAGVEAVEEALAWSIAVLWGRPVEEEWWSSVVEVSQCGWNGDTVGRVEVAKHVFTTVLSAYHGSLWRIVG